jgi:uncharacterized repeat protein (TIGR03803 family)
MHGISATTRARFGSIFGAALLAALVPVAGASAAVVHVVHAFAGGSGGGNPGASLVPGRHGMLYGTTGSGGADGCGHGCGTVFSLARDGTLSVLHAFQPDGDGIDPVALVRDGAGNLYGVTVQGGDGTDCPVVISGCGTLFKIAPNGTETILHAFQGGTDGTFPYGLNIDGAGNLYGVTGLGGFKKHNRGFGTVFEMTAGGAYSVLYAFQGGTDGLTPSGNLARDGAGNLYGATTDAGAPTHGTVFKLTPGGVKTTLHAFGGNPDGSGPQAGVVIDGAGKLYGTTTGGGASGHGAVFKVDAEGTESVLYSFAGGADGGSPEAGVILDGAGNLYGDTYLGGTGGCPNGCGVIFAIAPGGTETTLVSLGKRDGGYPGSNLFLNANGLLFGTTSGMGPDGLGTVFRLPGL